MTTVRGHVGEPLTPRESEVRYLLEQGRTDKQIAAVLGIAPNTVRKHVSNVLHKTGAQNRGSVPDERLRVLIGTVDEVLSVCRAGQHRLPSSALIALDHLATARGEYDP